jgi:hypothetical protein
MTRTTPSVSERVCGAGLGVARLMMLGLGQAKALAGSGRVLGGVRTFVRVLPNILTLPAAVASGTNEY